MITACRSLRGKESFNYCIKDNTSFSLLTVNLNQALAVRAQLKLPEGNFHKN